MVSTDDNGPESTPSGLAPELLCQIRSECAQLVATAFWLGDSREDEAYALCFTPDGMLDRAGDVMRGRQALALYVRQRPTTVTVRHFNSMPVMMIHNHRRILSITLSTVYRWDADTVPTVVKAEVYDQCVLTEEGWRIAVRKAQPCGR